MTASKESIESEKEGPSPDAKKAETDKASIAADKSRTGKEAVDRTSDKKTPAKKTTAKKTAAKTTGATTKGGAPDSRTGWRGTANVPGGILTLVIVTLAAALLGGLVAAFWVAPSAGDEELVAANPVIAARIGELRDAIDDVQDNLAATDQRAQALDSRFDNLDDSVPRDLNDTIGDLDVRLDGLEQAVASLSGLPANEDGNVPGNVFTRLADDVASLGQRLDAVNTQMAARLDALEALAAPADLADRLSALAQQSDVTDLAGRLASLERDQSGTDAKRAVLALALANLMRVAETGEPFLAELNAAAILAPGRVPLADLQSHARSGVKSRSTLMAEFDQVIDDVFRAEREVQADTWWQKLWANIRALVTIRRTGDLQGETTEAIIARTEMRMEEGQLVVASQEMHKLTGPGVAVAATWLTELDAKVQLDALIAALTTQVLADFVE